MTYIVYLCKDMYVIFQPPKVSKSQSQFIQVKGLLGVELHSL